MYREVAEVLLLCRRDKDAEKVLTCFRGDGRVLCAECFQSVEAARFTDACLPKGALRLVVLDGHFFGRARARQYLNIFGAMPRTATGLLLRGEELTRRSGEYWSLAAHRSRCAGLILRNELEAGVAGLLDNAFRLVNAAWPEKSVGRVPEAAFLISGSLGEGGLLRGQIWNRYLGGPKNFTGLEGLLFSLDKLCDELGFPQRCSIPRSIQAKETGRATGDPPDEPGYRLYVPDCLDIPPTQFLACVKIWFRASCSMQGELCGMRREEKTGFCSAEELAEKFAGIVKKSHARRSG